MGRRNPKAKKPMTKGGVIAMSIFASPFLLWGIYSAYYFLKASSEYSEMQTWVEVPAMIESVELVDRHRSRGTGKTKGSGRTMYKVVASYSYEFGGQKYTGDRVSLHTGSDGNVRYHHEIEHELKKQRDERRPFRCFVNPDNPQQAVLYREWRWKISGLHLFHAIVFGGLGAFLIGSAFYYWGKQKA